MALLSVSDLAVTFDTDEGELIALDGVDFSVDRGETVCLVGESGSGKTVACESITRLLPTPPATIEGEVQFDGQDLVAASDERLRSIRGDRIAHVFQNPQGALDPVYTVGEQLVEAIRFHRDVPESQARARSVTLLDRVGIPDPDRRIDDYPHEFSAGMKQRIVVAMALSSDPDLLVADEPTTALDVTTQANLLDLFRDLQETEDVGVLFVTHDLGVVASVADRVVVLYAGRVMEHGTVFDVFDDPRHPYTRALLEALPRAGREPRPIDGSLPDPTDPPDGCRFHPRCTHAVETCRRGEQPPLHTVRDGHRAACVYYGDGGPDASRLRVDDGRTTGPASRRTATGDDGVPDRAGTADDGVSDP